MWSDSKAWSTLMWAIKKCSICTNYNLFTLPPHLKKAKCYYRPSLIHLIINHLVLGPKKQEKEKLVSGIHGANPRQNNYIFCQCYRICRWRSAFSILRKWVSAFWNGSRHVKIHTREKVEFGWWRQPHVANQHIVFGLLGVAFNYD